MADILQLRTELPGFRGGGDPIQSRHRGQEPGGRRRDGAAGLRLGKPGRAVPRPGDDGDQHGDGDRRVGRPRDRPAHARVGQPAPEPTRGLLGVARRWRPDGSGYRAVGRLVRGVARVRRWQAARRFHLRVQWRGRAQAVRPRNIAGGKVANIHDVVTRR